MANSLRTLTVVGYAGCSYFDRAASAAQTLEKTHPAEWKAHVESYSRPEYLAWLKPVADQHKVKHTSSPIVFIGTAKDGEYLGGCDATIAWLAKNYPDVKVSAGGWF